MDHKTALSFVVVGLFMAAACSEPGRLILPTSPTGTIPQALPGAELSSAGPSELALKIAGLVRGYDVNRIEGSANVSAGQRYEVSVALHYAKNGNTNQAFELTTRLEP